MAEEIMSEPEMVPTMTIEEAREEILATENEGD